MYLRTENPQAVLRQEDRLLPHNPFVHILVKALVCLEFVDALNPHIRQVIAALTVNLLLL
jgi:hypothetical protein